MKYFKLIRIYDLHQIFAQEYTDHEDMYRTKRYAIERITPIKCFSEG